MSAFKTLVAVVLLFWHLPAPALWSPEPAEPPLIGQIEAFGSGPPGAASPDQAYVSPAVLHRLSERIQSRVGIGQVHEIIRTPDSIGPAQTIFSQVDVAKVRTADARAEERRLARGALQDGVSIAEPGGLWLLGSGLLLLGLAVRGHSLPRRISRSRAAAAARSGKSSFRASSAASSASAS